MDFPNTPILPRHQGTIHTNSQASIGGMLTGVWAVASGAGLGAANRAIFIPFRITEPLLVKQMFHYTGTTQNGNLDVGIYGRAGTRLVSSGSTAQGAVSVLQAFDVTDTLLDAGLFYFAVAMDGTTGTTTHNVPSLAHLRSAGVYQMASAFPLPATAVFATLATARLPIVGLSTKAVL